MLLIGCFFVCKAHAGDILNIDTSKNWNINGVPVGDVATTVSGSSLKLMSTGTATKKVGIAKVKLFVIQTYAEHPENFVRTDDGASSSINNVGVAAIKMTFLRSLDSATVSDAINAYLSNAISPSEMTNYANDIANITAAINSQDAMYSGDSLNIVGNKNNVLYENSATKVFTISSANPSLTTKIFAMFLSNTIVDNDGISLREQLLQDPALTFGR